MQIIRDIDQSSDEWIDLRLGFVTASKFKYVIAKGQGKTRKSYMMQIAAEILTGQRQESYSSQAIEWGSNTEPQARAMYEFGTGYEVEEIAFCYFEEKKIGCSPDGLVGDDGLVEFKCPNTTTQIETVLSGKMPLGHKPQTQGQMWVMEREWCDFVSFDPRIAGEASFFIARQYRDEDYIKMLSDECDRFLDDLSDMVKILNSGEGNQ